MDSLRRISFILCSCFCGISLFAQNITDLSVMNEEKETVAVGVSDNRSTINDSVFLHPDRIRYDSRCIQIDGKDVFVFSFQFVIRTTLFLLVSYMIRMVQIYI